VFITHPFWRIYGRYPDRMENWSPSNRNTDRQREVYQYFHLLMINYW
jgi:hypothetical protein